MQRRYLRVADLKEVRARAAAGFSVTRTAEFLGVHRLTLVRVAQEQGIVFAKRGSGAYAPYRGGVPGINNGNAKLTTRQVLDILKSSLSAAELATKYKVTRSHVWKIRRGEAWNTVTHRLEERKEARA